jgi:hypothetical protein
MLAVQEYGCASRRNLDALATVSVARSALWARNCHARRPGSATARRNRIAFLCDIDAQDRQFAVLRRISLSFVADSCAQLVAHRRSGAQRDPAQSRG